MTGAPEPGPAASPEGSSPADVAALPLPPALPAWPLLGNLPAFLRDRHALLRRGHAAHGPVFSFRLGPQPVAALLGPEHHGLFFGETDRAFSMDRPYANLAAVFGRVAFLAGREEYQEQRPALYAPFRPEKMRRYVGIMAREAERWVDSLGTAGEFEAVAAMKGLTQAVAGHALMGDDFQRQVGRAFWAQYDAVGKALNPAIPPHWPLPRNIMRERAKRRMTEILRPLIAERRAHAGETDDFLQDFVETRGKSGEPLDDEVVIGLVRALMFAGHETTAGHAAWTLLELLRHPDYLARVMADLAALEGPELDGMALRKLVHLHYAVKEVERLHPSADILLRFVEEAREAGGYRIPAGWLALVSPAVAHRLPGVWTEPEAFDPLRFAPGREEGSGQSLSLIGFGGGRHKCPGMNFANTEIMIVAALLLRRMELTLVTKEPKATLGMGASRPKPAWIRYRLRRG